MDEIRFANEKRKLDSKELWRNFTTLEEHVMN